MVTAAVLAWMGYCSSPTEALQFVCDKRAASLEHVANPSQRRCVSPNLIIFVVLRLLTVHLCVLVSVYVYVCVCCLAVTCSISQT